MDTNQAQPLNTQATSNVGLPNLRFGDAGDAVRVLQRLLINNRYAIKVDGAFGALTETAVKAFQSQRNLKADGIVGQKTWRELAN
ncbi:peptidoglycan-binding protein [Calothrix sp. FACHB-1219]|nr:peptidoglycan-binding protein [Calothrix sp. FACHB-168]MBD2216768.1 peptidoglycan-binding protein [Calothrix sp. FACHB-1219]